MQKCHLCLVRDADKKGSHIVPHFLLKRIDNVGGKTSRDYELGFAIGELDTESYFGRSVSPEMLEDIFGQLRDEEIRDKRSPLIVDNYFCSHCEARLSTIESEYAQTLSVRSSNSEYESGVKSNLGILFWVGVLWRMSIHQKSGTYLSEGANEFLRILLDTYLTKDGQKPIQLMADSADYGKISYSIHRCIGYSEKNITYLIWHPEFRSAYSLVIDEFIVIVSVKNVYSEFQSQDFFGFSPDVLMTRKNTVDSNEIVNVLSNEKFGDILKNVIQKVRQVRNERLHEFWDALHLWLSRGNEPMPEHIKTQIRQEMSSEEKKFGHKHSLQEIQSSTCRVLQSHLQFYYELIRRNIGH
jgi:hypothetical protein